MSAADSPPSSQGVALSAQAAGRSCPISYRYTPASLATLATTDTDVLYCAGGLYGNLFALDALERLIATETSSVAVAFNGDFHWFDAQANAFLEVETRTSRDPRFYRLRGNVETEIAADEDNGCGCAYPDSVDDGVVERSNDILRQLRAASRAHPVARSALAALPMHAAFRVGKQRVVVVHGDLESLAGWRLDPKSLDQEKESDWALRSMRDANADIVASSHTCLPALRSLQDGSDFRSIVNNGSAGMPCFANTRFGVVTRIARLASTSSEANVLYRSHHHDVVIEAIALEFDFDAWRAHFLALWPRGTAAHDSYFSRIVNGTNFTFEEALGEAVVSP